MSHEPRDEAKLLASHNTARYFVENRHISWVLLAAVMLWGVYGYLHMPQRKDPDIPVREAVALCPWPGIPSEKVEQLVTRKIEQAISANDEVDRIEATTRTGLSVVKVKLQDDLDSTGETFDDINNKLMAIAGLPEGAGPVQFIKDFGDTATLMLTVASPPVSEVEAIRAGLVRQVTGMVRWRESVLAMQAAGVDAFVEFGGKVLGPMVKRIAPDAEATSVVSMDDIEALLKAL